ncbi:MAG: Hsp20/alpha crystallin family protein [Phycisphaerae bacterium]
MSPSGMLQRSKSALPARREAARTSRTYRPAVDIVERADELIVTADMPGTTAEEIDVRIENGTLSLRARVHRRPDEAQPWLLGEFGIGDYERDFTLGDTLDPANVAADYRNGVLTIRLRKTEAAKPRTIRVDAK